MNIEPYVATLSIAAGEVLVGYELATLNWGALQ
jgi:hypothetical protein